MIFGCKFEMSEGRKQEGGGGAEGEEGGGVNVSSPFSWWLMTLDG